MKKMLTEDISLCNIVKFDGTNFQSWKFQLKTLFDYNGLMDIVEGKETLPEEVTDANAATRDAHRTTWKRRNAKT